MEIVIEEGLSALTLGKVAAQLDVAIGGLYRYFASKDALMVGLQQRAIERFATRLDEALAALPSPQDEGVAALRRGLFVVWFFLEEASDQPDDHRLMDVFLSAVDPSLTVEDARAVETVLGPIIERCVAQLERAAELGVLEPGDARARTLIWWGGTHGLEHLRHRERIESAPHRVDTLAREFWRATARGWGASAEQIELALAFTTPNQ